MIGTRGGSVRLAALERLHGTTLSPIELGLVPDREALAAADSCTATHVTETALSNFSGLSCISLKLSFLTIVVGIWHRRQSQLLYFYEQPPSAPEQVIFAESSQD